MRFADKAPGSKTQSCTKKIILYSTYF